MRRDELARSWLRALQAVEKLLRPLQFTRVGPNITLPAEHAPAYSLACKLAGEALDDEEDESGESCAVCGDATAPMRHGVHYVEFTLRGLGENQVEGEPGDCAVGLVGAEFDPTARDDEEGYDWPPAPAWKEARAWMFEPICGELWHEQSPHYWPGQDNAGCRVGDVVGLLLDLDAGTLAVYRNGTRLGVMVRGKQQGAWGSLPSLEGPLHWAVDIGHGAAITIDGPKPPPVVTAADLEEDERQAALFRESPPGGNDFL